MRVKNAIPLIACTVGSHASAPRNDQEQKHGGSAIVKTGVVPTTLTFFLCTSHQMMRDLEVEFRASLTLPVLVQGETSKREILRQFVDAGNAVLVATNSFWEGVDVRGDVLSCVIIDKLPFTAPDDPLLKARIEDCQLRGGDPFAEVQIPEAVIALKQGVGRLIRDSDDRSVLIICDQRLVTRPYGKVFLQSLPPARRTRSLERTIAFLTGC